MEKQAFLSIFRKAEEVLAKDYRDYGVDYEDIHSLFQFLDQIDEVVRTLLKKEVVATWEKIPNDYIALLHARLTTHGSI